MNIEYTINLGHSGKYELSIVKIGVIYESDNLEDVVKKYQEIACRKSKA